MNEQPRSFWMNPWTYTVIGTVIAGIILAFVLPTLKSSPAPPGNNPTATTASTPPQSAPSASVAVRYQGPIAINSSGVDLDAVPPATDPDKPTFYQDAGGRLFFYNGTGAEWTGSSTPAYSQCHNLVVTQGGGTSPQLASGLEVCVLTGGGHTAYVRIVSQSANGWEAQITVWNR